MLNAPDVMVDGSIAPDDGDTWRAAMSRLEARIGPPAFSSWFSARAGAILIDAHPLTLLVATGFRRDWVNRNFGRPLRDAAGGLVRVVAEREWPAAVR